MSAPSAGSLLRRRFLLQVFPAIMLPMFISVSDQTMIAIALPAIAVDLGEADMISWTVVAYLMAAAVATPVYGRLGDLAGCKHMLSIALCIVVAGALVCCTAPNLYVLVLGRVIQGLGGGGLMALSMALVGHIIPPRERGKYQGYLATVHLCASTLAPLIGGVIIEHFGWRFLVAAAAPLAVFALIMVRRLDVVQVTYGKLGIDFPGIFLFSSFVVPFIVAMNELRTPQMDNMAAGAGCLAIAGMALLLLLRFERRALMPLFQLDVLSQPAISRSAAIAFCHGAAMMAMITLTPFYLQTEHDLTPMEIAQYLMTLTVVLALSSIATGQMVSRTGRVGIFPSLGLTLLVPIISLFAIFGTRTDAGIWLALWYAAIALCFGTVMNVLQLSVQIAAGAAHLGAAAAVLQMARTLGAAMGASAVTAVFFAIMASQGTSAEKAVLEALANASSGDTSFVHNQLTTAFQGAFFAIAIFVGIGAALAWRMPLRKLD